MTIFNKLLFKKKKEIKVANIKACPTIFWSWVKLCPSCYYTRPNPVRFSLHKTLKPLFPTTPRWDLRNRRRRIPRARPRSAKLMSLLLCLSMNPWAAQSICAVIWVDSFQWLIVWWSFYFFIIFVNVWFWQYISQ